MTNQEIFNKVAKHLLAQKQKSNSLKDICLYYGPNGLKCAVGCLIPPEKYDVKFEDQPLMTIARVLKLEEHYSLLKELQRIHGNTYPVEWPAQLRKTALVFNLFTEVLCQP